MKFKSIISNKYIYFRIKNDEIIIIAFYVNDILIIIKIIIFIIKIKK